MGATVTEIPNFLTKEQFEKLAAFIHAASHSQFIKVTSSNPHKIESIHRQCEQKEKAAREALTGDTD